MYHSSKYVVLLSCYHRNLQVAAPALTWNQEAALFKEDMSSMIKAGNWDATSVIEAGNQDPTSVPEDRDYLSSSLNDHSHR